MILKYQVTSKDILEFKTINDILKKKLNFSTRLKNKIIQLEKVLYNDKFLNTNSNISIGDTISIDFSYPEDNSNIIPTKMPLDIIYEDKWFIVVNKPAGMPIHPSSTHIDNSLSNGIKNYFDKIKLNKKIRPVNRLDFDTSGLAIFAKCEYIQDMFSTQMSNNIFKKEYLCIVTNILKEKKGTINFPIARNLESIIERCIDSSGKPSITEYEVIKYDSNTNLSLVKCILLTGRTHQIRVHMKAIGNPLLGDSLYGSYSNLINRQALHCYHLNFVHPITNNVINLVIDLPLDMQIL